ncbi:hypothetical protein SDC9_93783 [bioreactor metagenome]|uniref:Uncharacterized protein n=1 Tax=bioreactor metagenome TaxID=1076179 RepID=A0A645A1K2_9ZZZZ
MPDGESELLSQGIDGREPPFHPGIELKVPTKLDQVTALDRLVASFRLIKHELEIGEDAVHPLRACLVVCLLPELLAAQSEFGDEGILLHILGGERLVKVIHQGDGGLFLHGMSIPQPRDCLQHLLVDISTNLRYRVFHVFQPCTPSGNLAPPQPTLPQPGPQTLQPHQRGGGLSDVPLPN